MEALKPGSSNDQVQPLVSVIIVEYQSLGELKKCLCSLRGALQDLTSEILVVSNSRYTGPETRRLEEVVDGNRLIRSDSNVGFAKAVNAGLREAQGEYIFLLNPDCVLPNTHLVAAIGFLSQNPQIAVLGPRIVDEQGCIQESVRSFITPLDFGRRIVVRFLGVHSDRGRTLKGGDHARPVDWVSGASMLIRRSAIDCAGMMDERYFMYVEDMDWCRSFRSRGYEVVYWPHLTVIHSAARASSAALSAWWPSRLMWVHFSSYVKYLLKAAFGAWNHNSEKSNSSFSGESRYASRTNREP